MTDIAPMYRIRESVAGDFLLEKDANFGQSNPSWGRIGSFMNEPDARVGMFRDISMKMKFYDEKGAPIDDASVRGTKPKQTPRSGLEE